MSAVATAGPQKAPTAAALPVAMLSGSSVITSTETTSRWNGPGGAMETINVAGLPESRSSTDTKDDNISSRSAGGGSSSEPLPPDLQRILGEVARTGACSWLPWNQNLPLDGKDKESQAAIHHSSASGDIHLTSTSAPGSATSSKPPASNAVKYGLGVAVPSNCSQNSRRSFPHSNRLATSSSHYASGAVAAVGGMPSRNKKHRNGMTGGSRRRMAEASGSRTQTGTTGGRKRPLFLIRTSSSAAPGSAAGVFSPGSVGSGRTSGSEPDDSTQYECDSEGTSATTNSELSTERRDRHLRNMHHVTLPTSKLQPTTMADDANPSPDYHCLKDAFRLALSLVLDHWYRERGGYKLSPSEKQKHAATVVSVEVGEGVKSSAPSVLVNGNANSASSGDADSLNHTNAAATHANPGEKSSVVQGCELNHGYQKNMKKRSSLGDQRKSAFLAEKHFQLRRRRLLMMLGTSSQNCQAKEGPPFTMQRIAEVLIAPERYYTQTHKLCNCLEKLLLVTSSTSAFGGGTGGVTSQSRREECELAALADEKGRLESEFRQRALKRRCSAMTDDLHMDTGGDSASRHAGSSTRDDGPRDTKKGSSPERKADNDTESSSREMLEAAARSLRTKFDHVGIDPHSSAVANRDVRSIAENRGMTNSPPPPSLAMAAAAASNIALPGHGGVGGFSRQHLPEQNSDHLSIARVPSPILFSSEGQIHPSPNMHMLHIHHAAALAGVSMGSTPFDAVTIEAAAGAASAPSQTNLPGTEGPDLEGRSSASNSDVDSESDDVSFDDSASDRSDGSDSGHYEPFTAARAMALNRIQQQQRLQSRVLTSLALHQSEGGFRPPADSEYQSGDSIDSTRGEDSGGSDSSSDLAD